MSMSDEVAGATLQVSMHAAEKAVDIVGKATNDVVNAIAKLLQALMSKQNGKDKDRISKTDLTDIKPGEVKVKDLITNAKKNGDSIATSDHGLTVADKKYIAKKAKEYGIPIAFTGDNGKDNRYAAVRKNDLPILERICTDMMKDKLAERPQELGNFKVQEWEMPFITSELNKHDLSAQFGKTESGEHFCLYEKADEKAILIARGEFVRKSDEVKKELSMDRDEKGFLTIKDLRSGREISFEAKSIPSREELSEQMQTQFGYDKNKADIACARFGEEQLQGVEKQKFFSNDPQQKFSKVDTNINLEGESVLVKPYTCWRVTPKQDSVPRLVFQDTDGKFAVLNPEKQTKKAMREALSEQLGIADKKTLDALADKAVRVTDYYQRQNEENFSHDYTFEKKDFLTDRPEEMDGMLRKDENGNTLTKTLPVNSISNSIERTRKDNFTVESSLEITETDQNGETHSSFDNRTLVLSFSDKKNAVAELTKMYREQGVPEHIAKPMAQDVFNKAQAQSAEKVLHLEEIRSEVPTNSAAETQAEIFMTVKFGNKTEEINITDPEKAIAEVSEKFDVGEEAAAALLDRAAEEINENSESREDLAMTDINESEHTSEVEKIKLEELDAPKDEKPEMERISAPEIGSNGHEATLSELPDVSEMPMKRGRH